MMKKIIMILSVLFSILNLSNANAAVTTASAGCLLTSCTITCDPGAGAAVATCAWGFATCACGGTGSTIVVNKNNLTEFIEFIQHSGSEFEVILADLNDFQNNKLNSTKNYGSWLEHYVSDIESLSRENQALISGYINAKSKK